MVKINKKIRQTSKKVTLMDFFEARTSKYIFEPHQISLFFSVRKSQLWINDVIFFLPVNPGFCQVISPALYGFQS
jgi:hypothetical protein